MLQTIDSPSIENQSLSDIVASIDFKTIDPKALAELLAGNHPIGNAEDHLYIYSIVPLSLEMPVGKTCPQAGHAYLDSFCAAQKTHPELAAQYRDLGKGGSKVALKAKNHRELIIAWGKALEAGLPCALAVDKTHILPPHFDGTPIITALGIGPCTKAEARHIVKKFQCL